MEFISNSHFFLGIFVAWQVFDHVFSPVHLMFVNLLYPGYGYH